MSALRIRSTSSAAVRPAPRVTRSRVVVRAAVTTGMTVAEAIKNAQQVCSEGTVDQCQSAWDAVDIAQKEEEFEGKRRMQLMRKAAMDECVERAGSATAAQNDPLEKFCGDNPDADECRVYEA